MRAYGRAWECVGAHAVIRLFRSAAVHPGYSRGLRTRVARGGPRGTVLMRIEPGDTTRWAMFRYCDPYQADSFKPFDPFAGYVAQGTHDVAADVFHSHGLETRRRIPECRERNRRRWASKMMWSSFGSCAPDFRMLSVLLGFEVADDQGGMGCKWNALPIAPGETWAIHRADSGHIGRSAGLATVIRCNGVATRRARGCGASGWAAEVERKQNGVGFCHSV
jgi:hypothetical protein